MIVKKIIKYISSIPLRLINYFYYTARPKALNPISYLRDKNEKISINELKKIDSGKLFILIKELLKKSGSTGCEFSDYYELYKQLNHHKPKMILECGSGISSLVIAYFISKRSNAEEYKCISCEENQNYHSQIKNIFPADYAQFIDFVHLVRKEGVINGINCSFYDGLPKKNYDYIFIDGPTFRINSESQKCFNSDLINIIKQNDNITVNGIMDQRMINYITYRKLMPHASIKYNVVKKLSYLENISQDKLII